MLLTVEYLPVTILCLYRPTVYDVRMCEVAVGLEERIRK